MWTRKEIEALQVFSWRDLDIRNISWSTKFHTANYALSVSKKLCRISYQTACIPNSKRNWISVFLCLLSSNRKLSSNTPYYTISQCSIIDLRKYQKKKKCYIIYFQNIIETTMPEKRAMPIVQCEEEPRSSKSRWGEFIFFLDELNYNWLIMYFITLQTFI